VEGRLAACGLLIPLVMACIVVFMRYAWDMNALSAGEEVAVNLGVNIS